MRTVVFGNNGFVGSNISSMFPDETFKPSSGICNLTNLDSVINYLDTTRPKYIVNMAAFVAGFLYNKDHNLVQLRENTLIALNTAYAIQKLKLDCYYIYISSACVYGKDENTEKDIFASDPNVNNYGYGWSKRLGHVALESLRLDNKNDVKTCVLIPTNMYGPHDNFEPKMSHVIPNLIRQMVSDQEEINVLGNPYNERDFMYVEDLGFAIKHCLNNEIEGIYNVSTSESISIKTLVETLVKTTGYKGKINFGEGSSETANIRSLDNEELTNRLGLAKDAYTDLEEGLRKTVEWYKAGN